MKTLREWKYSSMPWPLHPQYLLEGEQIRVLHDEELCDLYRSLNVDQSEIREATLGWACGYDKTRNAYTILVGKSFGK
jgi:alpha-D-ribose 1-methylphosphonate 5-triphosphate synthase subunit PhnL